MPDASDLEQILAVLSSRQLSFVTARLFCATDKAAAEKIGVPVSTVYNWPNKKTVDEAVRLSRLRNFPLAEARLRSVLSDAVAIIHEIALGDDKKLALSAAAELLDRGGLIKGTSLDVTTKGEKLSGAFSDDERRALIAGLLSRATIHKEDV